MTFGEARAEQARVHDLEDVKKILDVFQAHGHTEVGVTRNIHLRISENQLIIIIIVVVIVVFL